MPTIHEYVVKQERELRIRAENPHEAAVLAEHAFNENIHALQSLGFGLSRIPEVRVTGLTVEEEF